MNGAMINIAANKKLEYGLGPKSTIRIEPVMTRIKEAKNEGNPTNPYTITLQLLFQVLALPS